MRYVGKLLRGLVADEQGLETIEYAIIAGLITVSTLVVIAAVALWVANRFETLQSSIGA